MKTMKPSTLFIGINTHRADIHLIESDNHTEIVHYVKKKAYNNLIIFNYRIFAKFSQSSVRLVLV